MEMLLFGACAVVAVVFALIVVLHKDPIRSVLALVVTFFALAILYVSLSAPLIAALQIVVYAGAILVLFLFVIMLLNVDRNAEGPEPPHRIRTFASFLTAAGLGALLAAKGWESAGTPGPADRFTPEVLAAEGSVRSVARLLFERYMFAFEFVSVLLLAALVGAIVLTKKEKA